MNGAPSVSTGGARLPKQIQRQLRRMRELEKQAKGGEPGSDTSSKDDPSAQAPATDPTAASASEQGNTPSTQRDPTEIATLDAIADDGASPTAVAGATSGERLDASTKHWQNRYHSIVGELRAERKKRFEIEDALRGQIAELQTEVATLKAQTKPAETVLKLEDHFTAEQIDRLGEDQAAAILRAAHDATNNLVQQRVEAALAPLREREKQEKERAQRDKERAQADAEAQFFTDLAEAVPNWESIDKRPDWRQWCLEFDPDLLRVRQEIIAEARGANDARPVISLLKKYLGTLPAKPQPSIVPAGRDVGSGGHTPPPQEPAEILTAAQVKTMYSDVAKNRRLTEAQRDAEVARIDAMVVAAQKAGTFRATPPAIRRG